MSHKFTVPTLDDNGKIKHCCGSCEKEYRRMTKRQGTFKRGKMINEMRKMELVNPVNTVPSLQDLIGDWLIKQESDTYISDFGKLVKNDREMGRIGSKQVIIGKKKLDAADPEFFEKLSKELS